MQFKSLTYTSLASLDLTADALADIHRTAQQINALEGITGLLIFNGTHFLQIIEGFPPAIDALIDRLRRDPRHHGIEIRDERMTEERSFPSWSMELIKVKVRFYEARAAITELLPDKLPEPVNRHVLRMTEAISGEVDLTN